jgi:transposase
MLHIMYAKFRSSAVSTPNSRTIGTTRLERIKPATASLVSEVMKFTEPSPVLCALPLLGRMGAMSIRYDENTKARAVRLVHEHRDDYDSEWAAMKAISGRLGMNPETLRKWVRQAEVDAGEAAGVSSEERRELRELRRKCRELESTIEILKAATSFFARECDPLHR